MRKLARAGTGMAALALVGATALAGCGGGSSPSSNALKANKTYPGAIGSIPQTTGKVHATTITWAMSPGAVPNWINPIDSSGSNSVYNAFSFQWEMWRPLYWTFDGVEPTVVPDMSLASAPVWTNGDKTLSITMNSAYKWSNGQPMTAQNLQLAVDVIQAAIKEAPSNWAGYVPGFFPTDMTSSSISGNTMTINLKSAVNPTWFEEDIIGSIVPLPLTWAVDATGGKQLDWTVPANAAKIYNYISAQNKQVSTYATNPLWQTVDGPYKLTAFNPTTGAFTMAPNTTYGGPHVTPMSDFQGVPFTSDTAEYNAIKAGSIDLGYVPQTDVPQLSSLKGEGYDYFGEPDFGMTFANYNFEDKTGDFNNIVSQLYFRQAMAHLENEDGYVKAFMGGAGGDAYGPIPAYPQSPFLPANAATNPYPYSVGDATTLLKDNGWTINANGTDVCAKAGTATGDCGSGIPAGTKLAFNLIYSTAPTLIGQQMINLAAQAKAAGINITLTTSNFNYMISNYIDNADPKNVDKWAIMDFGGETDATYPTTFGLFNTGGGAQIGNYSNPTANSLIMASITSSNPAAVKAEASFLTTNQPVLFEPNPDYIWAWKTTIAGTPASFASLTQYQANPEFWYSTK